MTPVESEIVMEMLGTCEVPLAVDVGTLEGMVVVPGKDKPEAGDNGYSSCEEAAVAGEQWVQGNRGEGRGFPKAMVPSARDGDEYRVVCEN